MSFSAATLSRQLGELAAVAGNPAGYVIAFSGGLDSTVLLHALASSRAGPGVPLTAIHIDHGLHDDSRQWSKHCESVAGELGVAFRCQSVTVQLDSGKGPEASARDARYSALHAELGYGEWLISAHHREDQAETLLLNLIRGSGTVGIAGIAGIRRFGPGWLARPLLHTGRDELMEYAERHRLRWLEDPSNMDRRFDRNFLRHEILPRLKARWPDIAARLQRSAGHAEEASQLLGNLAALDLESLGGRPERLPMEGFVGLSPARKKNLLRHALRLLGLSTPTAVQLARVLSEVVPARQDAQPLVAWPGGAVRRYRNHLYLLSDHVDELPSPITVSSDSVGLGPGLGTLKLLHGARQGLSEALWERKIQVRFRDGGEEFKPLGHRHTRKLKKLLQEEGVVPWMRDRLPLVYADEELVAVGDLWLANNAVSEPGVAVRWTDRPAIH